MNPRAPYWLAALALVQLAAPMPAMANGVWIEVCGRAAPVRRSHGEAWRHGEARWGWCVCGRGVVPGIE